jgi:peptide/nickel transport system ATP-binding protein
MPVCRERFSQRTALGDGHWVHCFLYGEDGGVNGRQGVAAAPADMGVEGQQSQE